MSAQATPHPVWSLPLSGTHLIEASAGTGKTHTLVVLLLRAILVEGCVPRELVAVTYTRAAAGELRERVRAALASAARRAGDPQAAVPGHLAVVIDALIAQALDANQALTRMQLARRLRAAEMEVDALWLSTLHGFCQRLLAEFGPLLGVPGDEGEVDAGNDLMQLAATDAWRALQGDARWPGMVAERFNTPERLLAVLKLIVDLPATALVPAMAPAASQLAQRREAYVAAWRHAQTAAADYPTLADAIADRHRKEISRDKTKGLPNTVLEALTEELHSYFEQSPGAIAIPDRVLRLRSSALLDLQSEAARSKGAALPAHALPPALDALQAAEQAWRDDAQVALLHELHQQVHARLERIGFEQGRVRYDQLITRVGELLTGPQAASLQALARARWRLALIDEFQDTDAEQHAIFAALFGDRLILVGDPKQAIYRFRGGDVYAYQRAAAQADGRERLDECYRAQAPLVDAINAVFDPQRVAQVFREDFIAYQPVRCAYDAARHGRLAIIGEDEAAGLRLWPVSPDTGGAWSNKEDAGKAVVTQVGAAIVELLAPAKAVRLLNASDDSTQRWLAPRDIAVLCQTHRECAAIAGELRARAVPISLGLDPDIEAQAVEDVQRLLAAWLAPHDAGRLRALALSGLYAQRLASLPEGSVDSALTPPQLRAFAEQARLAGAGDIGRALLLAVQAGAAGARTRPEGEQRIAAWLRLLDRLVGWVGPGQGLNALYLRLQRWLADPNSERDIDAAPAEVDAVRVMTIHASKGLEFGVVFAPFLWNQRDPDKQRDKLALPVVRFHDDHGHLRADIGSDQIDANTARADAEEHAEAMRKAYVALTRARHRLYLPVAVSSGGWPDSALAGLLPDVDAKTGSGLDNALDALRRRAPAAIVVTDPPTGSARHHVRADAAPMLHARTLARPLPDDFRLLSYSRLQRGLTDLPQDREQLPATAAAVETNAEVAAWLPRGTAFGTCFHLLMETLDPSAPDAAVLARIADSHGYGETRARAYLERLLRDTWAASLPGDVALYGLAANARAAELEFFLPVRDFSAEALGRALSVHARYRRPPERWPATLVAARGYLRGYIDLIYRADERYYVLDYKTNDLGAAIERYQGEGLEQSIREHDYDLQYLIYLVALQRLLRDRLGADYDYQRHIGGAVYLFVRGLAAGHGVHHDRPDGALIDSLEAVFCGARP